MIHDSIAEEVESKGLYRRAAARWADVMWLVSTDKERDQVAKRRAECIRRATRPPVTADDFGALKLSIDRAEKQMGIDGTGKSIWRNYPQK
ncbi:PerC family transcriptional regulator [Escherichia coli]|nr:PerC family transcriptional regulator [Escherichia coli]ELM1189645.1 PerC family transcriptional regulator [Escherichia coli]